MAKDPLSTHSVQGLQRPSWPLEKVPTAQSTHLKPNLKFPRDKQLTDCKKRWGG